MNVSVMFGICTQVSTYNTCHHQYSDVQLLIIIWGILLSEQLWIVYTVSFNFPFCFSPKMLPISTIMMIDNI